MGWKIERCVVGKIGFEYGSGKRIEIEFSTPWDAYNFLSKQVKGQVEVAIMIRSVEGEKYIVRIETDVEWLEAVLVNILDNGVSKGC